jgi:hypothetical protein
MSDTIPDNYKRYAAVALTIGLSSILTIINGRWRQTVENFCIHEQAMAFQPLS